MTGARHGAWPCLCPDAHEPTPRTQPRSRRWHRPQRSLGQLRQRFLAVNAGRLQRARQALSSRQERVLRLLPLLFHINHPLLPGYLSASTPAGLSGFGGGRRSTRRSPAPGTFVCLQATQAGTRTTADPRPVPDGQPGEPGPGGTERSRPLGLPCPRTGARRARSLRRKCA